MKGQSEIVIFILLFVIGLALFISAVSWSSAIFDRNIDMGRVSATESFIEKLDKKIQSVIKFGGQDFVDYNIDGTIELIDASPDVIEIKIEADIAIPEYWINVTTYESLGIIQEMKDGHLFRIKLYYPPTPDYEIDFFTEGPKLSTPQKIIIEKNDTIEGSGITKIKIKLTFD